MPRQTLAELFALTDLHVYLTVPFVLSWSLFNALACGTVILASRTAPVCEVIEHERQGLLADFFDVEGLVEQACRVLDDPAAFRPLREVGQRLIQEKYSLSRCKHDWPINHVPMWCGIGRSDDTSSLRPRSSSA